MSRKLLIRIALGVLVLLIVSQFIRPSRETPYVDPNSTFMALEAPSYEVASVIKAACYDCHSYETKYPWYANVAPISWWIGNHISEGREHLNFSEWGKYPIKKKIHKAEESAEEVAEGHMPETAYTWMHANARLTDAQRKGLAAYFEELKNTLGSIPAMPSPTLDAGPMVAPPTQ